MFCWFHFDEKDVIFEFNTSVLSESVLKAVRLRILLTLYAKNLKCVIETVISIQRINFYRDKSFSSRITHVLNAICK